MLWSHLCGQGRSRRTAALALARTGDESTLDQLLRHLDAEVRLAALWGAAPQAVGVDRARRLLSDAEPLVVEAACWVLGELSAGEALDELRDVATTHADARCREAAIAALGAIGDRRTLDVVLGAASSDKPAIRRRALVALCGFDDPRVHDALVRATLDRDRTVRSVARDLLRDGVPGETC